MGARRIDEDCLGDLSPRPRKVSERFWGFENIGDHDGVSLVGCRSAILSQRDQPARTEVQAQFLS